MKAENERNEQWMMLPYSLTEFFSSRAFIAVYSLQRSHYTFLFGNAAETGKRLGENTCSYVHVCQVRTDSEMDQCSF